MKSRTPLLALLAAVACAPLAAQPSRITIPAAASIVGVSPFYSDVRVFNTSYASGSRYYGDLSLLPGDLPGVRAEDVHALAAGIESLRRHGSLHVRRAQLGRRRRVRRRLSRDGVGRRRDEPPLIHLRRRPPSGCSSRASERPSLTDTPCSRRSPTGSGRQDSGRTSARSTVRTRLRTWSSRCTGRATGWARSSERSRRTRASRSTTSSARAGSTTRCSRPPTRSSRCRPTAPRSSAMPP